MARKQAASITEPPERRCTCCYEGCPNDAAVKIKTPTGTANMCHDHLRIYHHTKAEKYCNDLGLDTLAKRKAWLRSHWPQAAAWDTTPTREPGEDPDEAQRLRETL